AQPDEEGTAIDPLDRRAAGARPRSAEPVMAPAQERAPAEEGDAAARRMQCSCERQRARQSRHPGAESCRAAGVRLEARQPMAVTINEGTTFLISDDLGDVPEEGAFGLFSEDTRFLCLYRLLLDGQPPVPLSTQSVDYFAAEHFLT